MSALVERTDTAAMSGANEVYGRLKEGAHGAGYHFERTLTHLEWLLDEDRWQNVGQGFTDINAFMASIKPFDGFKVAAETRKKIARKIAAIEGASQRKIAGVLGTSEQTVARDLGKLRGAPHGAPPSEKAKPELDAGSVAAPNGAPEPEMMGGAEAARLVNRTIETKAKREAKEQAREARRDENRQIVASVLAPEEAVGKVKFATIVIDPPWDWGDEGDQDQLGRARPTYDTWPIERLLTLPVLSLADDDCHLYLWITNRSLPKGFRLLESWGFRYVTCLTWVKPHFGMGNYFRGQSEQVLFGVKGSQPLKRKDAGTVFHAPRGPQGHSSKPIEFYELVESCSPGPYLEMFSRCERADWVMWGEGSHASAA